MIGNIVKRFSSLWCVMHRGLFCAETACEKTLKSNWDNIFVIFLLLPHRSQHPAEPFCFTGARGISDGYLIMSRYIYLLIELHTYALIYVYTYAYTHIYSYGII